MASPKRVGKTHVLEKRQHLIVRRIIGQEEGNIGVSEDGSNTNETSTASGDDGDILPGVLALLTLAVHGVVEVCNGLAKGLDASCRGILATGEGDVNGLGSLEAASYVVLDFGGALAEVGPRLRILKEAILNSPLGAPDDASRSAAGIETCVGHVPSISKLLMRLRLGFYDIAVSQSALVTQFDKTSMAMRQLPATVAWLAQCGLGVLM